jgi:hypothetical protein
MLLAKLINGVPRYAGGKILIIGDEVIVNPREEDWKEAGYKEVKNNPLPEKEGYYQVPEYSEDDTYIYINYHYEEIPDEPEEV